MIDVNDIDFIKISLFSPENIRKLSHGEVKTTETINYRSYKPEIDGLFCEKIFGPSKDYECHCGKYKKIRYQGLTCEKCGVDVTNKQVRRERFGHIELITPCVHIWFLKNPPYYVQTVLSCINEKITSEQLEEVVYYNAYICVNSGLSKIEKGTYINKDNIKECFEKIFENLIERFKEDAQKVITISYYSKKLDNGEIFDVIKFFNTFAGIIIETGSEAIKHLLQSIDVKKEFDIVLSKINKVDKNQDLLKQKLVKRAEVLNAFLTSGNRPEWMVLDVIPVLPADLRPMLPLDGGRFATSDLNNLYREIIRRNNRLKTLLEIKSPNIILMNEKRLLQHAVDSLLDNEKQEKPVLSSVGNPLKSLTAILKGKQGRLRQNLLGKRVDYSGRSVIVVGPNLRIYQCGLPREMAIQLFRPHIISYLLKEKKALTFKEANEFIDRKDSIVFDIAEKVISNYLVLLNRAPTLHRLGIQAFQPKLVDGLAIRIHPLVCAGFNADFDGDQMAIYIPLYKQSQEEAFSLMFANNNILDPKNGNPIVTPSHDMVLGNYFLTIEDTKEDFLKKAQKYREEGNLDLEKKYLLFANLEGKVFNSPKDVLRAYSLKQISLHNRIVILAKSLNKNNDVFDEEMQNMYLITSVGKIIFNSIFPEDFPYLNEANNQTIKLTIKDANKKKYLMNDFVKIGSNIKEILSKRAPKQPFKKRDLGKIIDEVFRKYSVEKTNVILDKMKDQGFKFSTISSVTVALSDINVIKDKKNILHVGDEKVEKIEQLYEKGMVTKQERRTQIINIWNNVKNEIVHSLDKQLLNDHKNPLFIMLDSGARGSLSNFVQLEGMRGLVSKPNGEIIEIPIKSSFRERMTVSEFFTATHGARKGGADTALKTANSGYLTRRLIDVSQDVIIREEDCGTDNGFVMRAIKYDGEDKEILSLYDRIRGRFAARDIRDPKTNEIIVSHNTLITNTLAKTIVALGIKEVEIRSILTCKTKDGVCAHCYGRNLSNRKIIDVGEAVGITAAQSIGEPGTQLTMRTFHTGGVAESDITQGLPRIQELVEARTPKNKAIISDISGVVTDISSESINIKGDNGNSRKYIIPFRSNVIVNKNDKIVKGQKLIQGVIDPKELLDICGKIAVENYLLSEIHKPYHAQGIEINDKHIEIIVKQMLSKVLVIDRGDTKLLPGNYVDFSVYVDENREALFNNKKPALAKQILCSITKVALESKSFLSAISFQETSKFIASAAVHGQKDILHGIKENVIVGKLIPTGRGLNTEEAEREVVRKFNLKEELEKIDNRYDNKTYYE
ncbi:MAG: DNA-directed RNA polymerase subunit beta' [Bacilli bacterium]|nr:DNA-directed RNA polymerase subunit beta' [Bacilli bacterium]